ncbi:hypothetical protein F5Y13DRAFT_49588 [Hypoxylon sp. FL1857]|nr:hypothetical protein F5Y13DRAFT_49588 [Hypoxylon sp. FL1857]
MKNFGAIIFLMASAGSLVTGTPAFSNERRALSSEPLDVAARAIELSPRVKTGAKVNGTDISARSLGLSNSTLDTGAPNKARSLVVPRSVNTSDVNGAQLLSARQEGNLSEIASQKRSPRLRRANLGLGSVSNGTSV